MGLVVFLLGKGKAMRYFFNLYEGINVDGVELSVR